MNYFAIILGLGAALGLFRVSRQRSGQGLEAALLALFCCFIGSRLGYAAERMGYFSAHPGEILAVWLGGLSGGGAVLGWVVGLLLAAAIFRVPVLRLSDWLYPLIPPLAVAGFLALWLVGLVYGPTLQTGSWWGVSALDESGQVALRWPLQLGAALALWVFYWLLELRITIPRPAGWLSSLAITWFVLVCLVVALLRADPVPPAGAYHIHVDILENLVLLVFFLGLFTILTFIDRKKPKMGKRV